MVAILMVVWVLQIGGVDIAYFHNYESCAHAKAQLQDEYRLAACIPHVQEQK